MHLLFFLGTLVIRSAVMLAKSKYELTLASTCICKSTSCYDFTDSARTQGALQYKIL